jgi:Flp pilus assembly pilin Flp
VLPLFVTINCWLLCADERVREEKGQTSAEYALVVMGAAFVALVIATWAKSTDRIGALLDKVFDTVTKLVK